MKNIALDWKMGKFFYLIICNFICKLIAFISITNFIAWFYLVECRFNSWYIRKKSCEREDPLSWVVSKQDFDQRSCNFLKMLFSHRTFLNKNNIAKLVVDRALMVFTFTCLSPQPSAPSLLPLVLLLSHSHSSSSFFTARALLTF